MKNITSNYVRDINKDDRNLFKTQLEGEFDLFKQFSVNFVRKLNKEGTKFEKLGGGWGKLIGPRTGSYGQN